MKMTLKKGLNTNSLVLRHNIMLEVSNLTMGREGALQTEKDLYLILAFMDNLVDEDLIAEINEDGRNLTDIVLQDIEPEFLKLMEDKNYKTLFEEIKQLHYQRCKEIWDNQHSIIGLFDTILASIAAMSDEDKKEALVETSKIAEEAFNRRTEIMENKIGETNSKLEDFIRNYQEKVNNQNNDSNTK